MLLQRNWGELGRGFGDAGRRLRNLFDRGGNGSTPPPMQMVHVPTATNSINFVNSYNLPIPTSLGGAADAEGHGSPAAGLSFGVAGLESAMNYVVGVYELSGPASPFASFVWAGHLGIGSIDPSSSEFRSGEMHATVASLAWGVPGLARSVTRFGGNVARQGVSNWVRQSVRPAVSRARTAIASRLRGLFGRGAQGGGQFRRIANTGAFSSLEVPMQMKVVKRTAKQAGVGLNGVKVKIVRDPELIGKGLYGHASEKGVLTLYPDAFSTTENLVKTLGHERTHLMQFKLFGPVRGIEDGMLNERAAFGIEETFWQFFQGGR